MAVEFLATHNVSSRKFSLPHLPLAISDTTPPHPPQNFAAKKKRSKIANDGSSQTEGLGGRAPQPVQWRGHGGRHPTTSSVEFDRQLDKVSIWIEGWDHDTVSLH